MKLNRLICLPIALLILLSGCAMSSKKQLRYTVLEVDFSDSISGVKHVREYDFGGGGLEQDPSAPESFRIMFNNEQYEGTYRYTDRRGYNNYLEHSYRSKGGPVFDVDDEGNLVFFFLPTSYISDATHLYSQEECLTIAKNFLANYTDISRYQIEVDQPYHGLQYPAYMFTFVEYINGFRSIASPSVSVSETGQIFGFDANMLNRIPQNIDASFDKEKIDQAVNEKINSLYTPEIKSQYDEISTDVGEYTLILLEDNSVALICSVVTTTKTHDSNGTITSGEKFTLLILPQ